MKYLQLLLIPFVILALNACSSSSDSDDEPVVSAPSSISGKSVKITVSSGSGGFASTGTAEMVFSNTTNQYIINGDTVNVADSAGTFLYSSSSNKGTIAVDDSGFGKGNFNLTFTSTISGTYTADMEQNPSASQKGSFEVQ